MKPANDPDADYGDSVRDLVRRGYDRCAGAYAAQRGEVGPELRWLTDRLSDGARVLDIGCGAGVPVTRALAVRHNVVGVDLSAAMIELAQRNVPDATFLHADVMAVDFPDDHFDAAVAFYSIFHLPREEHAALFGRLARWVKPGGYLLATLTPQAEAGYTEDDFFGVTMYWSNYGLDDYVDLLAAAGFRVVRTSVVGHGYDGDVNAEPEHHPIVLAQKTLTPPLPAFWERGGVRSTLPPALQLPQRRLRGEHSRRCPRPFNHPTPRRPRTVSSPLPPPHWERGGRGGVRETLLLALQLSQREGSEDGRLASPLGGVRACGPPSCA